MQNLIPTDKEQAIKTDIATLQQQAKEIVVTDDTSAQGASEFLAQIKARLKRLKELRMELTRPFKEAVKNADNWFKTQESPLSMMEMTLKQAIGKYMEAKEAAALKEQKKLEAEAEKARLKAEEEAALAKAKGQPEPVPVASPVPVEPMEKPKSNIQTEAGLVSSSKIWKWKVSNEKRIPRKFLKTNDAEVTKAVRSGERKIEGIKIYQETSISVR